MWDDREPVCRVCGFDLTRAAPGPRPGPQAQQGQPPQGAPQPAAPQAMRPIQPAPPPAWTPQWQQPQPVKKAFTWADICTLLGFCSSIMGYFGASLLLLPVGLVASLVGFRGDRTKALAVAGIVISVVGLLIKLMSVLYDASWLPYWLTNGVW